MYRVNNWKERHFDNIYKKKATKSVLNLYNRTIPKPLTNGLLWSTDSFQWDSVPLTHEFEKNKRKVFDCGLRTVRYLPTNSTLVFYLDSLRSPRSTLDFHEQFWIHSCLFSPQLIHRKLIIGQIIIIKVVYHVHACTYNCRSQHWHSQNVGPFWASLYLRVGNVNLKVTH